MIQSSVIQKATLKQITPPKMGVTTIFDKALITAIAQKEILLV
jgi:hypothetical protein